MPPKRGARAPRGGGRGRGAGQDNGAATESGLPKDVPMPDAPVMTPTVATETTALNSSGAPSNAPFQRLPSIRGRGRGRGAPLAGAAPPAFKPKAVRRDQSERQKAAEEEAKRVEERQRAIESEEIRGRGRGRGVPRGGRGRGDAMGKRSNIVYTGHASGTFSQLPSKFLDGKKLVGQGKKTDADANTATVVGPSGYEGFSNQGDYVALPGRSKADHDAGGGGGGGGGGRGGGSDGVKIKKELPDPIYPDQGSGCGARGINIEKINLISDDEDEVGVSSGKGKGRAHSSKGGRGLKPVRIPRQEHQERTTVVTSEASGPQLATDGDSADDGDDSLFVPQDLEAERRRRNQAGTISRDSTGKPWASVWSDDEAEVVRIKPEPDTSDAMDINNIPAVIPKEGLFNAEVPIAQEGPSTKPKPKPKLRRAPSWLERYPEGLHTDQDRAEWERHKMDKRMVAEEFKILADKPKFDDADGDVAMEAHVENAKEGRLYLFSFPPMMPPLYNPSHIKEEDPPEKGDDPIQMSTEPARGISGSSTAPIDISKPPNPADATIESRDIKKDPDEKVPKKSARTIENVVPEEGFIGKMIVRKSGKVELSWGGTSFEVGRGFDHDFLVSTMLVDKLDEGAGSDEENMRLLTGTGLGSVKGSFVVTPDWSKYNME